MADSFTIFAKFGDVCAALNEEDRKELIYAVNMYGMFGETVELPYHLAPIFIALKDDIDHSKESRKRGSKGGRPPKEKPEVSDKEEPEVSETEKPGVSAIEKPEVSETEKPGVSDESGKTESQYRTVQNSTEQNSKGCTRAKPARFTPPTLDEVAEYVREKGYGIDPERFCDYYAANGWKAGRNPMKDWRAAVRNWERGDEEKRKEASREEPVFGDW